MKKILLVFGVFILVSVSALKAQCYATIKFDTAVSAGVVSNCGNSTFNITTLYSNELILISYNGWNGPGSGPVTVNGNAAIHIATANNGNSGSAEVYAYSAPTAGTYTIVCNETGYNSCYYDNFAAAFYASGSCTPISIDSLVFTLSTLACTTGGPYSDNITTTDPGSMIYCSAEINEGQITPFPISFTGATFLSDEHTEDGIDAAHAYEPAATPGLYTVNATNSSPPSNGCGGEVLILVDIKPPACTVGGMTATPSQTNPNCGSCNGVINVTVGGGTAPYTYTWTPPVSTASGASNLCPGSYTVNIRDAGCSDTTITVRIPNSPIVVTANITANEPCFGDCLGSAASSASGGVAPYTYAWTPSGGTDSSAVDLCARAYTVTVHDVNGCTGTATVNITQPNALSVTVSSNPADSACAGQSVILNASGANSYQWSTGATTSSISVVMPAGDTAYYGVKGMSGPCSDSVSIKIKIIPKIGVSSITASNDSICKHGTSILTVTDSGNGHVRYKWNTGGTTSSVTISDTESTTYTVTVYGICDSVVKTITIKTIPPPSPVVTGTLSKCKGAKDTLTVNGGNSYKWSNGATTSSIYITDTGTTTYTVTTYGICDSVKKTITVTLIPPPSPVVTGASSKCKGFTDTLSVSGGTKYLWGNGSTTNNYITGPINADSTITVIAYNSSGCSDTTHYKVNLAPSPNVILTPPTVACAGNPVILQAKTTGVSPFEYVWSPGGQTTGSITVNPDSTESYTVVVSNGCVVTKTTTVTPDNPMLNACCDKTIFIGDDTLITASGTNAKLYQWNPSVNCLNPPCSLVQVTPSVTTAYTVTMTDSSGCQIESVVTIMVEQPCSNFIVPNVFTPNNPGTLGLDNAFYIKVQNITSWSIFIFDRWGKEVFTSTNPNESWNGKTESGGDAPAGVYYYEITSACFSNTYKKDGFVQLIR